MGSKSDFYYRIEGAHPEVTGSCNLVEVTFPNKETMKFVVDCGLFQEKAYDPLNRELIFDPQEIQFVLVTHNHVDHIGRLPLMVKKGYKGNIYTTKDTSILMPLALEDSQKVLTDVSKRSGRAVLYNEADVENTLQKVKGYQYEETVQINDNVKVTFFKNGHLVGAAMILVQISCNESEECVYRHEDINILFTGDYNNKNFFFDVTPLPEWVKELRLSVVQEATYGYMETKDIVKVFKNNVSNAIENKMTIIVPVFSLGRSQEILYEIRCMQENGELDFAIPIYFDGKLGIKYTRLFLRGQLDIKPEMKDFLPKNLTFVDDSIRGSLLHDTNCKIILTTSGMGSYGPAQTYLPRYISREDALIHFTGYTAEGTLGFRIKNARIGEKVEIGGLIAKKRAKVEYTTEYSAHAKADEMIEFLKQFKHLKLVLVNHGQLEVKKLFASRIVDEIDPKDVGILGGEYVYRVNAYGLVEFLSTDS